jgi:hypothetical protein
VISNLFGPVALRLVKTRSRVSQKWRKPILFSSLVYWVAWYRSALLAIH